MVLGAVVFTTICHYHSAKTGRRRGTSTTSALVHRDEVLSKARCDVCEHRCNFKFIQCDKCKAWCHYACAEMTEERAASIDHWYCRPCLAKERAEKDRHSVIRVLKRYAEPTGSDHLQKKTRMDPPSAFGAKPASESTMEDELELYLSDPSELELDFDDEPELKREHNAELELDLEDELEPERGVKAELELYRSDASELELDFDDEPELKRDDDVELELDLEDQPELELDLEEDPELKLEHESEPEREDDNEC
ncbi:hypothetical protein AAVH_30218 [Aphelenchoides avenae]|nr:hypothetical protein AAVH_30218 [Aphelenchus avenae]